MKNFNTASDLDLQLFAEGAGGAQGGTAGEGAAGVMAAAAGQQNTGVEPGTSDGNAGTVAAGQKTETKTDPNAAFEKLIKGEFKEQYDARVQDTIQKRLRSTNEQLQRFEAAQPIFDILAQRYGVEANDFTALAKAAQEDAAFFEQEAIERGVDVKDLMHLKQVERENAAMKRQMAQQQSKEQADRQFAQWMQQAKQAQQVYPKLDIQTEIKNPSFSRLLRSGVDVQTAYEVTHKDEIMQGAMQYAAQRAAKSVTDTVIAGAARPAENGTGSQGAVSTKVDPSKFTEKDIKDIREKVARGERITL